MKKLFTILAMSGSIIISAQCSIQAVIVDTACYCDGSAQAINPVGTPPFHYQWNFGDTTALTSNALCTGNQYVVTMTDSTGCTATDTVLALGNVMMLSHNVANTSCWNCCDGIDTAHAVFLVPACGPLLYQWGPGPPFPSPDSIMTGLCAGTYTVIISDQCGCMSASVFNIGSNGPTAIEGETAAPSCEIVVGHDQITFRSEVPLQVAEFYNLSGQLISCVTIESNGTVIDRPHSSSPLILRVSGGDMQWSKYIPPLE